MILTDILSSVITTVFLLFLLSYYALFFIKRRLSRLDKKYKSISVIIPAHNEEEFIEEAIESVLKARFVGNKEVLVVNDGSSDRTLELIKKYKDKVKIIDNKKHSGKSFSLNRALAKAKGDVIAIVDGDSYIMRDALVRSIREVSRKDVVATCGVVKVRNRYRLIGMWLHIELVYNSLIRSLFGKINANVVTPGALSVYRRKELIDIGGFSTEGFSEDVDIAIRLIRKGYKITFNDKIVSETNMPYDPKGFLRQRTRLARGLINLLKRHMKMNKTIIDIYTLPLFLFTYIQAVIMGGLTIYNMTSGYILYYLSKGVYFSFDVVRFFFEWLSIFGFMNWTYDVIVGNAAFNFLSAVGIFSTFLSYPLFFYAIIKYDKKFDIRHLIPIFFMAPYWLLIMLIYTICIPELLAKKQYNIWKKNE